ncbi:replication factor C subunit 2 [Blyttiomyces helicus]|uniref:Replication factor C subunit 2 n=1 Tax=Blyttiomyces helicus TaxID=388810 RepID=A0A4P9WDI2_9FUNG|nr:replication factor C subunit 2 [Blyttiomyces helicus]|eukprot:RKO90604.1 replication factor C subunit 2 [Blyttiomyces helicus]
MNSFFKLQPGAAARTEPAIVPWVEKYRPKNMNEISAQEDTVAVLKKTLESANLPHLLFYGPPGTGKTSTILALARELYGPEMMKSRILELNASDERGIDIVREKVKNFARTTVSDSSASNYPCPPYKIIILDEADSMTTDAQSALRRTMETYSKLTRFCLICNYVTRIIEPLASRCAKFRFKPLADESIEERLRHVAEVEGVNCPPETIKTLSDVSGGDLRKAIMFLQSAHSLYVSEPVTPDTITEIAGVVPEQIIDNLMQAWQSKKYQEVEKAVNAVVMAGYSAIQVLLQLHERVIVDAHLSGSDKSRLMRNMGKADKCLVDGADEHLQLLNLLAQA